MDPPLDTWQVALRTALAERDVALVDRIEVVAETPSTQDTARAAAGGRAGLLAIAGRQTAGRGRFSRPWDQGDGLGLAMTIVLDARNAGPAHVSLAAGVALARGIAALIPAVPVGLRWPNDAVETGRGRKLAGVLIEQSEGLYFVGFGLNVHQHAADWASVLRGHAASVAEIGGSANRLDAAVEVLRAFEAALALSPAALADAWRGYDILVGRTATFEHDGRTTTGVVESIDPAHSITLRCADGTTRALHAATASLVPERAGVNPRPSPPG